MAMFIKFEKKTTLFMGTLDSTNYERDTLRLNDLGIFF